MAALPPVQQVVIHPEDSSVEANGQYIDEQNGHLHGAGTEQKQAKNSEGRQKHKKNGYGNGDVAEGVADDCRLVHWNPTTNAQ